MRILLLFVVKTKGPLGSMQGVSAGASSAPIDSVLVIRVRVWWLTRMRRARTARVTDIRGCRGRERRRSASYVLDQVQP